DFYLPGARHNVTQMLLRTECGSACPQNYGTLLRRLPSGTGSKRSEEDDHGREPELQLLPHRQRPRLPLSLQPRRPALLLRTERSGTNPGLLRRRWLYAPEKHQQPRWVYGL